MSHSYNLQSQKNSKEKKEYKDKLERFFDQADSQPDLLINKDNIVRMEAGQSDQLQYLKAFADPKEREKIDNSLLRFYHD